MKKYLQVAMLSTTALVSMNIQAEAQQQERKLSIGLGTYVVSLTYDDPFIGDDGFGGLAISAAYALTDNVALRGAYYKVEHDDFSDLEAKGLDLSIVAGTGLATQGFKIYGGAGFFNETWTISGVSGNEKFSGLQFVGGLGYNWDEISLDFSIALRDSDDYADLVNNLGAGTDVSAASGGLTLSLRF